MNPITILIVDDHKLIRETWKMVLSSDSRLKVVAACGTAETAIDAATKLLPNVVLLDINLPGINGIEAIPLIRQASPSSKIIGVSMHTSPNFARKMMKQGAMGYVTKNASREDLIEAIISVSSGKKYICNYTKDMIAEQFTLEDSDLVKLNKLSPREFEIIELIKKGFSSKEIAENLSVSVKTVEVHRYNILKKLDLKNTTSLIYFLSKN